MPRPRKTKENPHGLTYKQDLVIKDITNKVNEGKNMKPVESIERFYNVKNNASARSALSYNMKQPNFRSALVDSLIEKKVLGADGLVEQKTLEGLDATTERGAVDYSNRLKYIQEINKIAGVYAPEVKKSMSLNLDMSGEELDQHIEELQKQLE